MRDGVLGRINLAAPADAMYDLASLTKVLATGLVATHLFATRQLDLDLPVTEVLPEWRRADARRHPASRPARRMPADCPAHLPSVRATTAGPDALVAAIAAVPLVAPPRTTAIYSDLGFIVLGRVARASGGEPLDAQVADAVRRC